MTRATYTVVAMCALLATTPKSVTTQRQEPTLASVLGLATEYVDTLHDQLLNVVANEQYQQRATTNRASVGRQGGGAGAYQRRTLHSDYLLVQPEGSDRHYGYRDVYEVDGRSVRDREERITKLFLDPSATASRQIQGILSDSSRHNIGLFDRNINTPTLALLFLKDSYKARFSFTRTDDGSPSLGIDEPESMEDLWVVEYRETWPTTIISTRGGRNMPASGRFWIEPFTGRITNTEINFQDTTFEAIISVLYEEQSNLGHAVPIEMRERYTDRRGSRVDGTATYDDYRRFRVDVSETEPQRN